MYLHRIKTGPGRVDSGKIRIGEGENAVEITFEKRHYDPYSKTGRSEIVIAVKAPTTVKIERTSNIHKVESQD